MENPPRKRFSQLNLTAEPLLAPDVSAGNFFEQAAAANEAGSGSQPDAAAASSDAGTDEDAAKAQALLAVLAKYLGKFPEAMRSALRSTWTGARLSGGDQVVAKAADERLCHALGQLVQLDGSGDNAGVICLPMYVISLQKRSWRFGFMFYLIRCLMQLVRLVGRDTTLEVYRKC